MPGAGVVVAVGVGVSDGMGVRVGVAVAAGAAVALKGFPVPQPANRKARHIAVADARACSFIMEHPLFNDITIQ